MNLYPRSYCGASSSSALLISMAGSPAIAIVRQLAVLEVAHWHDGVFDSMLALCAELGSLFPDAPTVQSMIADLENAIHAHRRVDIWLAMRKLEATLVGQFAPTPGGQARSKKSWG